MASQPPLLLVDNQFDRVDQYPGATVTASSYLAGHEPWRVADGRREDTWWEPVGDGASGSAGNYVRSDLGAGNTRPIDFLYLDRGHNLWGKTVTPRAGDDGATWPSTRTLTVPAEGTVGGDPTSTTMAVTEDGALYALFTAFAARRYRELHVPYVASFVPKVTGIIMGARHALAGYGTVYAPDQGRRSQPTEEALSGRRATGPTYHWRTLDLGLMHVSRAEYDATVRDLRRLLFELNQPAVVPLNYGDYPARAWMYQFDGSDFQASTRRVHFDARFPMREVVGGGRI